MKSLTKRTIAIATVVAIVVAVSLFTLVNREGNPPEFSVMQHPERIYATLPADFGYSVPVTEFELSTTEAKSILALVRARVMKPMQANEAELRHSRVASLRLVKAGAEQLIDVYASGKGTIWLASSGIVWQLEHAVNEDGGLAIQNAILTAWQTKQGKKKGD